MAVPLLDLKAQFAGIRGDVMKAVEDLMDSQMFILGEPVRHLEERIAEYCGCRHAVGVSSGTDALVVSLMSEGIGPGDEVITSPYTFFSTAGSISRVGARPVFVDIEPSTFNIDPSKIEDAVTPRTKAIIPVHLYGQAADMDPIMEIARGRGLAVIEDAAQAIGSEYKNRRAGSIGDYGCFSFFPSKNLGGAGDGGMVAANDDGRLERLRMLRVHGGHARYYHDVIGGNFRLDALQAAVLLVKLDHLEKWTNGRRRNADLYRRMFESAGIAAPAPEQGGPSRAVTAEEGVILPRELPGRRHIYNQFVIRFARRDDLRAALAERSIGNEVYYPVPLHLQKCYAAMGYRAGDFPESEAAARDSLALPVYPELTEEMIGEVVGAIAEFAKR